MGQLMKVMQVMAREQEEIHQENLRVATANPILTMPMNPLGGNTPIVNQPPYEGDLVHQNTVDTFDITVQRGVQTEIDDHQDTFFIPKVNYVYDAYRPSLVEVEKKFWIFMVERVFDEEHVATLEIPRSPLQIPVSSSPIAPLIIPSLVAPLVTIVPSLFYFESTKVVPWNYGSTIYIHG
ncbi:hypothetical protein KIW84_064711 [Lathyrus oleraceus]|uniref:Uncharacterized protein n=1 Tax=Pisum sativum TaxID=3888 RepID=A0A9D4WB03_PEA|nr:hypothetical protein KIW84_064711 [Pisum sativum]